MSAPAAKLVARPEGIVLVRRPAGAAWPAGREGWWRVLRRAASESMEDRLPAIGAGVVFYALLAVFPAITALVSSYGLFVPASSIADHLTFLSTVLPADVYALVHEQVARVVAKGDVKLGFGFLIGFALAVWSANAGMKAVIDALNVVREQEEARGFIKLNAVSLLFTLGALAAALVAAAAVLVAPVLFAIFGLASWTGTLAALARWPLLAVAMTFGLSVLYRYGPCPGIGPRRFLSIGAAIAALLWILGSGGLSFYLANFGHYDAAYGSLAAAIGAMMWMWMSAMVALFGAEIDEAIEAERASGQ